jgi:hypothetical protein
MSYLTNSTANRLKINKGWKNPSFPETLPLYSRDNVFLFKLYLFLTAYFMLNQTRLVYCDLRTSENYTKILYLVINSVPKQLNKKKSFRTWYVRKLTSGFKYSPFRDIRLHQAINLLYLDLPKLKKQVSAKLLPLTKHKVNKAFYKKTRYKSWINFLAKIKNVRKSTKSFIKRKNIRFKPVISHNLNLQQSFKFKLKRIKNEVIVLNRFFSALKAKSRLTKQNIILYKKQLYSLKNKLKKLVKAISRVSNVTSPHDQTNSSKVTFNNTFIYNTKSVKQNRLLLRKALKAQSSGLKKLKYKLKNKSKKINLISQRLKSKQVNPKKVAKAKAKGYISKRALRMSLLKANIFLQANKKISISDYKSWVKSNIISRLKYSQFLLKFKEETSTRILSQTINAIELLSNVKENENQLISIILNDHSHKQFLNSALAAYIDYLKENNLLNTQRSCAKFITLLKSQHRLLTNKSNVDFTITAKLENNSVQNVNGISQLNYPTHTKVVKSLRRKRSPRGGRAKFILSLLSKSRTYKRLQVNTRRVSKTSFKDTVITQNVSSLVKNFNKKYKKYNKQLKAKRRQEKRVWKFRESFRSAAQRHQKILTKYQYKIGLQNILLKYFKMNFEVKIVRPLAQFKNLKFLRLIYPVKKHQKSKAPKMYELKKTLRKRKSYRLRSVKQRYLVNTIRSRRFAKMSQRKSTRMYRNTYISDKQADRFARIRKKETLESTKNSFNRLNKKLLIHSFTPIASLVMKYLNPQLLADHIAKEFEKSKRHQSIIYALQDTLSDLPFNRAKGYHISIAGRINASDKTRSYYFNRSVLNRQDFFNKVNFASAQAHARIGVFGIKVWIFY